MNAATLAKPIKGLILASSLFAASSLVASAADLTVPLGTQATNPLTGAYMTPPTGLATLGGHTFDLSAGKYMLLSGGQSASYTGSWANAKAAYVLLNSGYTYLQYQGLTAGTLTLTFSDNTTQSVALVLGKNLREWRPAGSNTVNTISDPATSNVWTGTAEPSCGGGTAVIDMLTVNVPTAGKTLTGFSLSNNNATSAAFVLSGLTIGNEPVALGGGTGENEDVNDVNPGTKHAGDTDKTHPIKKNPAPKPAPKPKPPVRADSEKHGDRSDSENRDGDTHKGGSGD